MAYLRHPPKLVAAGHETITVEINFDSENIIGNDGHKQVKYYQLLWKVCTMQRVFQINIIFSQLCL